MYQQYLSSNSEISSALALQALALAHIDLDTKERILVKDIPALEGLLLHVYNFGGFKIFDSDEN